MADLSAIFDKHARDAVGERKRQDFDDLQNELAGRDTGRMRRFLSADAHESREGGDKRERDAASLSRLQLMLASDPRYKALYDATFDRLRDAESQAATALALAIETQRAAQAELDDILAKAATLSDGSRVFKDKTGQVRREDGTIVDPAQAGTIAWRGNEPSYDDYRTARENLSATARTISEIERYQVDTLGSARDRLTDDDNPPDARELADIQRRIIAETPKAVRDAVAAPDATSSIVVPAGPQDLPKL
ncbi:MAG: hypothetical protein AAF732_12975 [Pseudomonadota bacterium]